MNDEQLRQILEYDPLASAENLTGRSYKDSDDTASLGFVLAGITSRGKDAALKAAGDTRHGSTLAEYLEKRAAITPVDQVAHE